jgi:hypothetical protein
VDTSAVPPAPEEPSVVDPVIAVRDTQPAAQAVVAALERAGFDMTKVSLVGKGQAAGPHAHGLLALGDRVKEWVTPGGAWDAAWGLLLGAAVVMAPPVGIVVAAGPFVAALLAVLEGAVVVGGVSVIAAALTEIGMPSDRVANYEADVKANRYLVIVHGSAQDVAQATAIARQSPAGL